MVDANNAITLLATKNLGFSGLQEQANVNAVVGMRDLGLFGKWESAVYAWLQFPCI
jgi:hypothetical protein